MPRFKVGDIVVVEPRFAHFFSSDSGVVLKVKEDRMRADFNEYTVRFPDGSTADLFEFETRGPGPAPRSSAAKVP